MHTYKHIVECQAHREGISDIAQASDNLTISDREGIRETDRSRMPIAYPSQFQEQ